MNFYDVKVEAPNGEMIPMQDYAGKVVVVVNTATGCGFTPQYKDLEALYERFHEQGLEIIDVPCNQFAGQAPESDEEIHEFPQMKKVNVNGEDACELFKYLKSKKSFETFGKGPKALAMSAMMKKLDKDYKNNAEIKWNFTKFVVDRNGEVVARFEPSIDMKELEKTVEGLI